MERSASDHVSIRVIPFGLEGFAGAASAMTYAGGAVPKLDTVVRDGPHGASFIDAEGQLTAYRELFRKVKAVSLPPRRSRDFIHRLTKELWGRPASRYGTPRCLTGTLSRSLTPRSPLSSQA